MSDFISYYPRNVPGIAKRRRMGKTSRTPGKSKNENCQTDPVKKFFATSPKAHKHPQYDVWHAEFKRINSGSKA